MKEEQRESTSGQARVEPTTEVKEAIEEAIREERLEEAAKLLADELDRYPDWSQGHAYLGIVCFGQQKLDLAKYHLLVALAEDPENVNLNYNLACVCHELEDYEEALSFYKEVVMANPGDDQAFVQMGECAIALGRDKDAIAFYQQAILLRPEALEPAAGLARIHLQNDDLDQAKEVLIRALIHHPDDPMLNYSLALVLELKGRYKEALPYFREAALGDGQNEETMFHLGRCAAALGLTEQAESFLARAIKLKPDYLEALYELGQVYHEQGNLDMAVASYGEYLNQLAVTEERKQEWGEEVDISRRTVALNALGHCLQEKGLDDQAWQVWRHSLELDPNQEEIEERLEEVKPLYDRTSLTLD